MARITYVARRGVIAGHSAGTSYSLDFSLGSVEPPNGDDLKNVVESIDGTVEVQYFGERRVWGCTTIPIQLGSTVGQTLLEALRSTADGQSFILDPYGTSSAPVSPLTVRRQDSGYTLSRFQPIDGVRDYFMIDFSIREI